MRLGANFSKSQVSLYLMTGYPFFFARAQIFGFFSARLALICDLHTSA